MKSLSATCSHELMQRLPKFELSYETIPHKKVSPSYNACVAIPVGKKCYAWFSFDEERDACYMMEINREKKISKISTTDIEIEGSSKLQLGTILYGSTILGSKGENDWVFIIEDILYCEGIPMKNLYYGERLGFLERILKPQYKCMSRFRLPIIWGHSNKTETFEFLPEYNIPKKIEDMCGYQIHHIQYRCLNDKLPYLNVLPPQKFKMKDTALVSKERTPTAYEKELNSQLHPTIIQVSPLDYRKPQYRMRTMFQVCADIQFDIYHLFAYGKNSSTVYYNIACIPNYNTSVFMNGIFRNIKENANLDAIEESDDEEDFENMAEDRFVDLQKTVLMECVFNTKFKKWMPLRVVDTRREKNMKVVHISQLVSSYY